MAVVTFDNLWPSSSTIPVYTGHPVAAQALLDTYNSIAYTLGVKREGLVLAGGAVRDTLASFEQDRVIPVKDWDVWLLGCTADVDFMSNLLANKFPQLVVNKPKVQETPEHSPYDGFSETFQSYGTYLIAGLPVNVMGTSVLTPEGVVHDFDSSLNRGYLWDTTINVEDTLRGLRSGVYDVAPRGDTIGLLQRSVRIADKLKLKLRAGDVEALVKADVSLWSEDDALLFGYRCFTLADGPANSSVALRGSYGSIWSDKVYEAKCASIRGKSFASHFATDRCSCGVWSYKGVPEADYLNKAHVVAMGTPYGIVNEYDYGWRSEKFELVKLWLVVDQLKIAYSLKDLTSMLQIKYQCEVELTTRYMIERLIKQTEPLSVAPPRRLKGRF